MPRLFAAVDLPSAVREDLANLCHGLPGARWMPMEQFHLTLAFLGETDSATGDAVMEALEEVGGAPFELSVRGTGTFPPRKPARVLWVGLVASPALSALQRRVVNAVERAGADVDSRAFHPHVTIARFRDPVDSYVTGPFVAAHSLLRSEPFQVTEFNLYSSELRSEGAVHTIERTYPLDDISGD